MFKDAGECSEERVWGQVLNFVATEDIIGIAPRIEFYFWIYRCQIGKGKGFRWSVMPLK